jgi:type I restriction enzyme S subunit
MSPTFCNPYNFCPVLSYYQQLNEWEEATKTWEENGRQGKKHQRPLQLKHIPEFSEEKLSILPPLPEGWTWASSGSLFQFVTSGSRGWAKYYSSEGAIFIRITNLNFDSLELDLASEKIQYVQPPSDQEGMRTHVEEGDFLFSITGYLGMFAIAPELEEAYVNQHIALARPLHSFNKQFIGYYITSRTGGFHYLNQLTRGAVKAGLTLGDIVSFPIPLCSVKEQEKIVNLVEMRLSRVYELDQKIKTDLQQAEVLRQSILKKAFSGQLVPQDSSDEHAAALLERIRETRRHQEENQVPVPKPRKQVVMKKDLSIIEVLQELNGMATAQDVWRRSKHQEDIEGFYAELKKQINDGVIEEVEELREEKKSYLRLRNEN